MTVIQYSFTMNIHYKNISSLSIKFFRHPKKIGPPPYLKIKPSPKHKVNYYTINIRYSLPISSANYITS